MIKDHSELSTPCMGITSLCTYLPDKLVNSIEVEKEYNVDIGKYSGKLILLYKKTCFSTNLTSCYTRREQQIGTGVTNCYNLAVVPPLSPDFISGTYPYPFFKGHFCQMLRRNKPK